MRVTSAYRKKIFFAVQKKFFYEKCNVVEKKKKIVYMFGKIG